MDVYRKNLVTIAVTIVTVFFPPPVNAAGCPSSECHYLPANLSPHVVCDVSQYGGTPPCYGEWSSIVNCGCDEDGFKISETGRTYWCQNGGWNPDVHNVKCTGPCTIDVGENVIVKDSTGRPTIITADTVESGENVRLSCPEGYGADGTATWTCHDGEWDGGSIESFKCLKPCKFANNSSPTDPTVVEPIPHGEAQSFQCNEGYIPSDIVTVQCNDGILEEEIVCSIEQPCRRLSDVPPNVKTVDSAGVETALFEHESYVTYECRDSGYTILGVKTATCVDGSWDNEAVPVCLGSCYFPDNARSTRNKVEPIPHGDTVILQCDDGYEPRDTVTAHCQDGILNPGLVCTRSHLIESGIIWRDKSSFKMVYHRGYINLLS